MILGFRVASAAIATVCTVVPALGQTDQIGMARQASANQLGILEYCQAQGYTDTSAVTAQKSAIAQLPPSTESTLASEATGKQGTILANGTSTTLASMARSHNTTEPALCKQMAENTIRMAAMRQNMGTMPMMPGGAPGANGMPTMPSGVTPGGIRMPGTTPVSPVVPPAPQ